MELLKSKVIIDESYKPTLDLGYLDYFNRALSFAQTNYQAQLDRIAKTQFYRIIPTAFFEEYAWCLSCVDSDSIKVSEYFPDLSKQLVPFYNSFWDLNNFPKKENVQERIVSVNNDENKFEHIYRCASILNRGIKLFGWEEYKKNFLSSPEKLRVLPGLNITSARHLSRNVGVLNEVVSSAQLHKLSSNWGFTDSAALCAAVQKNVALPPKVIEMIFWYAAHTF